MERADPPERLLTPPGPLRRAAGPVWIALLSILLVYSAHVAYRHTEVVPEFPYGCDSFGYLRMARQIRQAPGPFWTAEFHLEYDRTRGLIAELRAAGIPSDRWDEIIAPHAHHYMPRADAVGPQYPPGTPAVLALFPEGRCLSGLNAAAIIFLLTAGLAMLLVAGWYEAWAAAGFVAVATHAGLDVIAQIGVASFSINAVMVPLWATVSLTVAAVCTKRPWVRGGLTLVAGAVLGFGVLIRLPLVFLVPGLLVLLLPADGWRRALRGPVLPFLAGLFVCGILPLLWHQHRVAGGWLESTYSGGDREPSSLRWVVPNVPFYLSQEGLGGYGAWVVLASFVGLLIAVRAGAPVGRRFVVAAVVTWAVPMAYFLTHRITTHYYAIPSNYAVLWLAAFGVLMVERQATDFRRSRLLLAAAAGVVLAFQAGGLYSTVPSNPQPPAEEPDLPADFRQGRPWVCGDMTTSTVVYYADLPAYKVAFGDPEVRHLFYTHTFRSGEPQYLVIDSPTMEERAAEVERMGGRLEVRGRVATFPYYLIHWPPAGPARPPA